MCRNRIPRLTARQKAEREHEHFLTDKRRREVVVVGFFLLFCFFKFNMFCYCSSAKPNQKGQDDESRVCHTKAFFFKEG